MSELAWRRVVGFVLGFVVLGAGHILLGRWRRYAVLVGIFLLIVVPLLLVFPVAGFFVWPALVVVYLFDPLLLESRESPRRAKLVLAIVAGALVGWGGIRGARAFVLENFNISSGGMSPTLIVGDHIFVEKWNRQVERGDVIVFNAPSQPGVFGVRRVVATAGDMVAVRDGRLVVNGTPVPVGPGAPCQFSDRDPAQGMWFERRAVCTEEMLGTHRYVVAHDAESVGRADFPETRVPEGQVFGLGDLRDHTTNSRGRDFLSLDAVLGRVRSIWFSDGPDEIRWGRAGLSVR